ncbi:MAG: ferredoxin, partial [Dehalococcoidia bacterium]
MTTYEDLRKTAEEAWRPLAEPQRPLLTVGLTTCSRVRGADETLAAIRNELSGRGLEADVLTVGCWGLCYAEPIMEVTRPGRPSVLYHHLTADKVPE